MNPKPVQIGIIFKEAFDLYKANFILFLSIALLGSSVSLFINLPGVNQLLPAFLIGILSLIGAIVGLLGQVALVFAVFRTFGLQSVSIGEAFLSALPKMLKYFCVVTLCGLMVLAGWLFLIVPGIYLGTIFSLVGSIAILEDRPFFQILQRSYNLIKGYFWPVLGFYTVIFLVFLPVGVVYFLQLSQAVKMLIFFIFGIITTPLYIAMNVNLYLRFKAVKDTAGEPAAAAPLKGAGCLGCLGALVLWIVIIILGVCWFLALGNFFKSGQGAVIYDLTAEMLSPEMELNGLRLERPKGYFVGKNQRSGGYDLTGFINRGSFKAMVFSFESRYPEFKTGEIPETFREEIWTQYKDFIVKATPYSKKKMNAIKEAPVVLVDLAGRTWVERRVKEENRMNVFNYTVVDSAVIFVQFNYEAAENADPELYDRERQRILRELNLPK